MLHQHHSILRPHLELQQLDLFLVLFKSKSGKPPAYIKELVQSFKTFSLNILEVYPEVLILGRSGDCHVGVSCCIHRPFLQHSTERVRSYFIIHFSMFPSRHWGLSILHSMPGKPAFPLPLIEANSQMGLAAGERGTLFFNSNK